MKKATKTSDLNEEMKPEYDLASMKRVGRGRYAQAYRAGRTVRVKKRNGTVSIKEYRPAVGTLVLTKVSK